MPKLLPDRAMDGLRMVLLLVLAAATGVYVATSLRWPLVWDGPIMHYVNFLMDHGMRPYREISDLNMPGAYLMEGWAMRLFGGSDVLWRVYEFLLLGAMTWAAVAIARPYDWMAGVYAGVFFLLFHGSEGPRMAVERDEVMTILLLVGYAFLFVALRKRRAWMMSLFGLCVGMASAIKPTVGPLALLLLGMAAFVVWRRGERMWGYVLWGLGGIAVPAIVVVWFLERSGGVGAFLVLLRTVVPVYAGLKHPTLLTMLRNSLPRSLMVLAPMGVVVAILNRGWRGWASWERWALLLGMGFGFFSYFAQHKGFQYHRYTFVLFLVMLLGVEFLTAIRRCGWARWVGATAIVLTIGYVVPRYTREIRTIYAGNDFAEALEGDLRGLDGGVAGLQRQVQCFDLVYGCMNALLHLGLVQNTGFTGDLLWFSPVDGPVVERYREMFWASQRADPARVLVISNEWFYGSNSFSKMETWPEFVEYLGRNYRLVESRTLLGDVNGMWTGEGQEIPSAYRIYVRR